MSVINTFSIFVLVLLGLACALPINQDDPELYAVSTEATTHNHEHSTHHHHSDGTTHHHHEGTTHNHDGGDGGHDMGGHSMQMSFYASSHATILFAGWHTMTYAHLFGSCLAIMLMGFLYEGFKVLRISLIAKSAVSAVKVANYNENEATANGSKTMIIKEQQSSPPPSMTASLSSTSHIVQSLLHVVQLFCSYCLMLIFMTYNIYLCLALVIGCGIGYYVFAWKYETASDKNECCN